MDRLERGEIHDRVAVGMPTAEVFRSHLFTAEMKLKIVPEGYALESRLVFGSHVEAGILMREYLSGGQQLRVAACVVRVLVRIHDVSDRFVRNGFNLLQDFRVVMRELIVD